MSDGDHIVIPTTVPKLTAMVHQLIAKIATLEEGTAQIMRNTTKKLHTGNNNGLWTLYTDGGARPNPGPSGAGMVLVNPSGVTIWESSVWLGHGTNNSAEYEAVAIGVAHVVKMFGQILGGPLLIRSDSMLVLKCIAGTWKCKSITLRPIYTRAMKSLSRLPYGFRTEWIKGHNGDKYNERADQLATIALGGISSAKRHTR